MSLLTEEQRFEKAIQHVVVFAKYMHTSECKDFGGVGDVLQHAWYRVTGEPAPDFPVSRSRQGK